MARYTRQQWLTLIVFATANFWSAACCSLQAPFYPRMAEEKGVSPTQYGLVFGVFQLTSFLMSPLYGTYLTQVGPKFMFNAGIFTTACTCILFGFLDRINDTNAFIGLSFAIRIVEAMGSTGFITASLSIIAKQFPENVGATFASLETCYGLGVIVGPTVGGALFQLGGYTLPFLVVGVMLLAAAAITFCFLPNISFVDTEEHQNTSSILKLLKIPAIALAAYAVIVASCGIGFMQATLEPHLRPFELSPFHLSLMFVLCGGSYGASAPVWGWLCDKWLNPRVVISLGGWLAGAAFLILGPAPFLPIPTTLPLCILALAVHGLGIGAELVATFISAHRSAVANGFPDDIKTYGLVSGMWTSTFALGAFIGPSAAGALFDWVGFGWASVWVVGLHLLVALLYVPYLCCSSAGSWRLSLCDHSTAHTDTERTPLLTSDKTDEDEDLGTLSCIASQQK